MRVLGGEAASRAVELKDVLDALGRGEHVLVARDGDDHQRLYCLEPADGRVSIGRSQECDVVVDWDTRASRLHAELEHIAGGWVVVDDGLSANGTWVGGERVVGRRRLHDGDAVRCGATAFVYRVPGPASGERTAPLQDPASLGTITPMQRKVLVELCRPLRDADRVSAPATNGEIAARLFLSVDAVKTHLRALYERLGFDDLAQHEKRIRLAETALRSGAVSPRDLEGG